MTLNDAINLQEQWKTKYGKRICRHRQLFTYLYTQGGDRTEYRLCLECGGIWNDVGKPISPAWLKDFEVPDPSLLSVRGVPS